MARVLAGFVVLSLIPWPTSAQVVESGVVVGFSQAGPNGPARDNAPPATGRSTIRGRIVAADNGQPIRRATVRIGAPELRGQRTTMTDAEGRYEFAMLPAGRYSITAAKSVFVDWSFGQTQPGSPAKPVVLADGQVTDNINIALPRGSVITGRVTDELGEPMPGVSISLMRPQFIQGQQRLMPTGSGVFPATNDIGEYRMYGLAPGQYYITAQQQQQAFQFIGGPNNQTEGAEARNGYARTYYPGTADLSRAQKITVGIAQTFTEMNIMLLPTRLATISGVAVDQQGQPLGRGNVQIMPRGGMLVGGISGGPLRPDGTFTVPNVAPGTYTLRANVQRTQPEPGTPPGPPEFSVAVVTVNGEDITDVRLTPVVPVTISGRVSFDDPAAAQSLMPSAIRVMAQPLNLDDSAIGFPGAGGFAPVLQQDFSFELKTTPGRMGLRAVIQPGPGGPNQWQVKAIRAGGTDVTDSGLDVDSRGATGIEIELTNRRQQISGKVADAGGDPVKDYIVLIFAQDRARWTAPLNRYLLRTQADANGLYKVSTLPPGDYYAIALDHADPTGWQDPEYLDNLVRQASTVSLAPGDTRTLDLRLFTTP